MGNVDKSINALKSTKRHIVAYNKVGMDELIIEAEKAYVYEQYDLANEICNIILTDSTDNHYSMETLARAYELRALILYYNSSELYGKPYTNPRQNAYEILEMLDSKKWEVMDARYVLGKMYAEKGCYEKAINSFEMWMSNRDRDTGLAALVEMFKREQYDTDTQHGILFGAYFIYYLHSDMKDLLLRSAKYVEEYFPQYIHESISEKFGLPVKQVSKIHYTDEDFVLPYSLRCFDCADYIRAYVRNTKNPTFEGCMQFLARGDIQLEIQNRTAQIRKKELEEALLRSRINNENLKIQIMRKEAEENARRYNNMKEEMDKYNRQMLDYQRKSLQNQQKSYEELKKIKRTVNDVRSDLRWRNLW